MTYIVFLRNLKDVKINNNKCFLFFVTLWGMKIVRIAEKTTYHANAGYSFFLQYLVVAIFILVRSDKGSIILFYE